MTRSGVAGWLSVGTGVAVAASLAVAAAPVTWHLTGAAAIMPDAAALS
ncbi:hypothetical protein SAMN05444339_1391, partial [Loktanella atrilutea]